MQTSYCRHCNDWFRVLCINRTAIWRLIFKHCGIISKCICIFRPLLSPDIDGLMHNSIANALALRLSCADPSICAVLAIVGSVSWCPGSYISVAELCHLWTTHSLCSLIDILHVILNIDPGLTSWAVVGHTTILEYTKGTPIDACTLYSWYPSYKQVRNS